MTTWLPHEEFFSCAPVTTTSGEIIQPSVPKLWWALLSALALLFG